MLNDAEAAGGGLVVSTSIAAVACLLPVRGGEGWNALSFDFSSSEQNGAVEDTRTIGAGGFYMQLGKRKPTY